MQNLLDQLVSRVVGHPLVSYEQRHDLGVLGDEGVLDQRRLELNYGRSTRVIAGETQADLVLSSVVNTFIRRFESQDPSFGIIEYFVQFTAWQWVSLKFVGFFSEPVGLSDLRLPLNFSAKSHRLFNFLLFCFLLVFRFNDGRSMLNPIGFPSFDEAIVVLD